ncbi:hypothetical protein [Massilia consociata]|uniref:Uncharacterized protein n=1 Tax=Massilia consociata TaxID=760117 RepID=A0ABV6FHP4_9BURK
MFKYFYEAEELGEPIMLAEDGPVEAQLSTGEQFPVISAYIENLPSGLIGDEV